MSISSIRASSSTGTHFTAEPAAEQAVQAGHPDPVDDARAELVEDDVAIAVAVEERVVEFDRGEHEQAEQLGGVGADPEIHVAAAAVVAGDLLDPRAGRRSSLSASRSVAAANPTGIGAKVGGGLLVGVAVGVALLVWVVVGVVVRLAVAVARRVMVALGVDVGTGMEQNSTTKVADVAGVMR